MKITICGSMAFWDEMVKVKEELEALGHEVQLPPKEIKDKDGNEIPVQEYYRLRKSMADDTSWIWDRKAEAMMMHFKKIEWADAALTLNMDKNSIPGYVGANSLIDMAIAFFLNKKLFLYNRIPDVDYKEEILGLKPVVIDKDLNRIT